MAKNNAQQDFEYQDKLDEQDYLDDLEMADPDGDADALAAVPRIRNMAGQRKRRPAKRRPHHQRKRDEHEVRASLADEDERLIFTYNVQRDSHERRWLVDSLGDFFRLGWLTDVLRQIKGGKEASVYLCGGSAMTGTEYVAAKIYRPRMFRNLRNDHMYREGRDLLDSDGHVIHDHGRLRAVEQKTGYGQQLSHASWIEYEYQTMLTLHAAGADIPQPFARGDNAILMQYIGDEVLPAPTLNLVNLDLGEAEELFARALHNLQLMLAHDCIHGDYSAYNILYWDGELVVIDFPQVVSPRQNRNATMIFERDVVRISEYFDRQGVAGCTLEEAKARARQLWGVQGLPLRQSVNPALLDAEDEDDLALWAGLEDER